MPGSGCRACYLTSGVIAGHQTGVLGGERQLVGVLGGQRAGRFAHPVAGPGVHPQQHRPGTGLAVLQLGAELQRVRRHHPVVVVTGADQGRRVGRARHQPVQRRVAVQHREIGGVVGVAVLGGPGPADGEQVEPQHVQHADGGQRGREQLRPLGHRRADQQPAVRPAVHGQLRRGRDPGVDQLLGAAEQVVEDHLFVVQHAGLVPVGTELAAAAQVRHRQHAAGGDPGWRTSPRTPGSTGMSNPP